MIQKCLTLQAGIPPVQLKLALEPEAAAIYVTKMYKTNLGEESLQFYDPGTKILIADLGGNLRFKWTQKIRVCVL